MPTGHWQVATGKYFRLSRVMGRRVMQDCRPKPETGNPQIFVSCIHVGDGSSTSLHVNNYSTSFTFGLLRCLGVDWAAYYLKVILLT